MKRFLSLVLATVLIVLCIPSVAFASEDRCILYVATDGNDSNDGSIESPLASLIGARNKIRELKKTNSYPKGYTVYVRGGTYTMTETLALGAEDSGEPGAPITYRAYEDETVTLSGGVSVSGKDFTQVTDASILNRLSDQSVRDKIYMLDLKKYGIKDPGETPLRGAYSYSKSLIEAGLVPPEPTAPASEVLFNGEAMTLARYPNDEYMSVAAVIEPGYNQSDKSATAKSIDTPFTIQVKEDRLANWVDSIDEGAMLFGFWWYDWAEQSVRIREIDVKNKSITAASPSLWATTVGRPFYIYNLIEEMDIPGEYYLDTENSILYLYPTGNINSAEIVLTLLETPIVKVNGASYVNFRGLDVVGSRTHAYQLVGGDHVEVSDCEISYTAKTAVDIRDHITNSGIRDSYIHDVEGGISLGGGKIETLEPGNNYVENCEIQRFSRLSATYVSAVSVFGTGNVMRNNEIHEAPHYAISFNQNRNKIMYNEIYDVVQNSDDAGAIYGGLDWVGRGNEIKYNYIHDIAPQGELSTQGSGVGGIYLDGGQCETFMVGNVFKNVAGKAVWINGGQDNVAMNNIFVDCTQGVLLNDIMLIDNLEPNHYRRLNAAPYVNNEIWKEAFPKLQKMIAMSDDEKRIPYDNICVNNIAYKSKLVNGTLSRLGAATEDYMDYSQNIETTKDPGFVDVENGDYTIKADSEVFETLPGFEAVAFTRMGRVDDRAMSRIKDAKILLINNPKSFDDGKAVWIDPNNKEVVPFIHNDVTYVPLRFLAEVLDATVSFDEVTGQVQISGGQMSLTIPSNGTEAIKHGETITLEHPTMIVNERTMVPLREISELFDKEVFWHNAGFISVSDDATLFDENGSDDEIIRYLCNQLNIY